MDIIPDILMAYLASNFPNSTSNFLGRIHCQDALSDPAVQTEILKVAQEKFPEVPWQV